MNDLVPLTTRLGTFGLVRALLAVAAVTTALLPPEAGAGRLAEVALATAGYGLFVAAFELLRRIGARPPLPLVGGGLLFDGVYLVAAVALTGGPAGPLAFLIPVHLIAVTLLASYRTGLKLAIWHSLLVAAAYHAAGAGLLAIPAWSGQSMLTAIVTFWFVAFVTAGCSALNERELRRGRAGYAALATMAGDLQQVAEISAVAGVVVRAVRRYTGYPRAAILLRPPDRLEVEPGAGSRPAEGPVPGGEAPGGLAQRSWDTRRPVLAQRLDPREDQALLELLPGARNVVVVPLLTDREPLGVLAVERAGRRGARIPRSVVTILEQFAAHAALNYENLRLREHLRRLAAVDGLTGLPNRRMFDDVLGREVERARRTGRSLTLLLCDIDHFKQVNDTHGHPVGDEVLRHVSRALTGAVRAGDLPARYGGEEFALLLPDCDAAAGALIAQKARHAVAAARGPAPVTVSVGVAALPGDAADAAGLVEAADAALYRAKATGRDRVVRATEPVETG